ncbi:alpha/beta hydrolase fold family protein [Delitschia confertaspora ATCC 74209]|uniref:Alpha/beta hydrolase fold family protein n=1 Tax=Delitschia confertaspora ATCC 74209 TaxID=1513339 RepID=A0A9P4MY38_9PLEO|nr:alpha/beta hydrolase fold family protein [Delitschia confertaspora ATCC 74209]
MPNTKTLHVPHLGGIAAAYQTPGIDPSKPTLIMINSFTTSSELYKDQFTNKELNDTMNLVAIELLGHGQTRTENENWTYWDTAYMNIQVMDALGIDKAFVLGTSQGGWVTVRMALLAPKRILGIIPLGTSLDFESERTRKLCCWDAPTLLMQSIQDWTIDDYTPDFYPSDEYSNLVIDTGFGKDCPKEVREYWRQEIRKNYQGDSGRRRIRMAAINLRDRDGLHNRLWDVKCPVRWLHGTSDVVYSVANAQHEIKLFKNSPDARLVTIEGGQHFLSFTHPKEVAEHLIEFVKKYNQ